MCTHGDHNVAQRIFIVTRYVNKNSIQSDQSKIQHGRFLETLHLTANRYLATSKAHTNLGVL